MVTWPPGCIFSFIGKNTDLAGRPASDLAAVSSFLLLPGLCIYWSSHLKCFSFLRCTHTGRHPVSGLLGESRTKAPLQCLPAEPSLTCQDPRPSRPSMSLLPVSQRAAVVSWVHRSSCSKREHLESQARLALGPGPWPVADSAHWGCELSRKWFPVLRYIENQP